MATAAGAVAALLGRSQLRFAWRNPVGIGATLVGICLAVVAVGVVHLVAKAMRADLAASDANGSFGYTHVATAEGLAEAAYFALRQRWRAGEPALAEVEALVPVIHGRVRIGTTAYPLIGFDPLADALRGTTPAPSSQAELGDFLTADVVLAPPAAVRAADEAGALAGLQPRLVELTGANALIADLPTAQRLLQRPGQLDAVWLRVAGHRGEILAWLNGLLPGIDAALPDYAAPAIAGYAVTGASRWQPLRRFADAVAFLLGTLAVLSVFMAAALAAQASLTNAARRRRERDRLLTLGAAPGVLRSLDVLEGALIGGIGGGIGLAIGFYIAHWLLQLGNVGTEPMAAASLDPWLIGKAVACSVLVAAAMPLFADREAPRRRTIALGLGVAAITAAAGLWQNSLPGAFATLLAVALAQVGGAVPALAGGVQALAGAWLSRSATPDLSRGQLSARTTLRAAAGRAGEIRLALGALSVAAATAIAMSLMVASLRLDFLDMLAKRLWPGVSVQLPTDAAPFDDATMQWVQALPGAQDVRRYGQLPARLPRGPVQVEFAELDAEETARYGFAGPLAAAGMLNEVGARLHDVGVGETVTVRSAGSDVEVTIAHVFRDYGAAQARLLLPLSWRSRFTTAEPDTIAWRRFTVRTAEPEVDDVAQRLAERFGNASIRNHKEIRAIALEVFDRTFIVSRLLAVVALAVAATGLYAALTAMLTTREHEFRLLTAIGYGKGEIWRLALAQTTLLGAIAGAAALPLGVFMAWVLCAVVQPLAFGWSIPLQLSASAIGYPLLLCVGVAVAAGALPCYRASAKYAA